MDSRVVRILKLLKLFRNSADDDDNIVAADKLFIASRELSLAYGQVDKGIITLDKLSHYVQALIEYRDGRLDFKFEIDKQTGEEQVYFTRLENQWTAEDYAGYFRSAFTNSEKGDKDAKEEDDSERS